MPSNSGSRLPMRLSPSMVVAVLALVAAAAGVAIAKPNSGGAQKKPLTTKQVRKIAASVANSEIIKRAPGLSVAAATDSAHATDAVNATHASDATAAATAESANPIAYAHVSPTGSVDPARAKGIASANVTSEGGGLYCFRNLGFAFKGAQVTTDYDDSEGQFAPQFGNQKPSVCTPDAEAYVLMVEPSATGNAGFFIVFYN